MAEAATGSGDSILTVTDLQVYYGRAHALQGVSLDLPRGVLGVVGRNGMGKTTLCNTLMGLLPARGGNVRFKGRQILGLSPNQILRAGIAYVPQGRRVWPSLSVDEHLRLAARTGRRGPWTVERVYQTFPRLTERMQNGGAMLSGGEQQMLAIGRALLANPDLLIMDEPTEGLAPVIVQHLSQLLRQISQDEGISVLLIEQNLGVAVDVSNRIAIMVNGRIVREMPSAELGNNPELQQQLLGMGRGGAEAEIEEPVLAGVEETPIVFRVRRHDPDGSGQSPDEAPPVYVADQPPTRWSQSGTGKDGWRPSPSGPGARASGYPEDRTGAGGSEGKPQIEKRPQIQIADAIARAVYVAGTFDTKGRELRFMETQLKNMGLRTITVDLSTSGRPSAADVGPHEVALYHPKGSQAVFTQDRGSAVAAMAEAFVIFLSARRDIGGIISAGGSGGTALVTPAMQALAIGLPKLMVSTVASGDVSQYIGASDISMMYSVTDVQGLNRISREVLANAAHALGGMVAFRSRKVESSPKPAIGLSMFGVTTPCVQAVSKALENDFDCLIFHATGTGGQSMEKLVDSGMLAGVIDVSTTEIADLLVGGVFSSSDDRLGAFARHPVPYVGSCGALDMVNWHAMDTVPERFRGRKLYRHNPQITLMRTTVEENIQMGKWIGERLSRLQGPVRFLIPQGGVSMLDSPGGAFWDPEADQALFGAIEQHFRASSNRRLIKLPLHINDPAFARALAENYLDITGTADMKEAKYAAI